MSGPDRESIRSPRLTPAALAKLVAQLPGSPILDSPGGSVVARIGAARIDGQGISLTLTDGTELYFCVDLETAMSVPSCRSCGAEIRWEKNGNGKLVPLDPEPTPNGNLSIVDGVVIVADPDAPPPHYVTHFATCPHADQWRKRR
jgi:hypothetical protein